MGIHKVTCLEFPIFTVWDGNLLSASTFGQSFIQNPIKSGPLNIKLKFTNCKLIILMCQFMRLITSSKEVNASVCLLVFSVIPKVIIKS